MTGKRVCIIAVLALGLTLALWAADDPGLLISGVIEDSPADRSGLKPMDAIISVDGERVAPMEFSEIIANHSPGDRIALKISRPGDDGDKPFEVEVQLGKNDDGGGYLGIRYVHPGMSYGMDPEMRDRLRDLPRGFRDQPRSGKLEGSRFPFPPEEKSDI